MTKLPKQWRHWCRQARLKPHAGGRRWHEWYYLKGRGRVWRVNDKLMFQCGDTYAEFDRWALCDVEQTSIPATLAEFKNTVSRLLEFKEKA